MMMRALKYLLTLTVVSVAIGSSIQFARPWPTHWGSANWASAGLLPGAEESAPAMAAVYCARAGRWRGLVASHCWVVTKAQGAAAYSRYDVVGWGNPVRRDGFAPDGFWYGNMPTALVAVSGPPAESLVDEIERAVDRYPYSNYGSYGAWPGPNSNTFVAWIGRQVPGLGLELPPTAVGKDYLGSGLAASVTPSGTGWQVSVAGLIGIGLAVEEGLELHLLGLTLGIDLFDVGIKLPAIGKLSLL